MAEAVVGWSIELHSAIETDDISAGLATVERLVNHGCVHYNLRLQGLSSGQGSISPIARAAARGRLEILRVLLREVKTEAMSAVLDCRTLTHFEYTPLHWACAYGHADVAEELIVHGCDTTMVNDRGKTAWDIAEACESEEVLALFDRLSSGSSLSVGFSPPPPLLIFLFTHDLA